MSDNNLVMPPPGSPAAIMQGCSCPVLDNAHGVGIVLHDPDGTERSLYWISEDCPLHGSAAHTTKEATS